MIQWRTVSAALGMAAVVGAGMLVVTDRTAGAATHLAGSGDSATGTQYTPPTVPAMSMGASQTQETPAATPSTTTAAPSVTVAPSAACSDNGVVLPGGCH